MSRLEPTSPLLSRKLQKEESYERFPEHVMEKLNEVGQRYGLNRLESDDVRVLSSGRFNRLVKSWHNDDVHPVIMEALRNFSQAENIRVSPEFSIPNLRYMTGSFGRTREIYIRKDPLSFLLWFFPQDRNMIEALHYGPVMLEEMIHANVNPSVMDGSTRRDFVDEIVTADITSKVSGAGEFSDGIRAYRETILEYLDSREVLILCGGMHLGVEVDGRFVSASQYNANEIATETVRQPLLEDFHALATAAYEGYMDNLQTRERKNSQISVTRSQVEGIVPDKERVRQELTFLAGSDRHADLLEFYLSGQYLGRRLIEFPKLELLS